MHNVLKVPITVLSARSERAKVSKGGMKRIADEEFTDSAGLEWSIWRAGEFGRPLLSPRCPHRQNTLLASASFSFAVPYEPGCFVLAEES